MPDDRKTEPAAQSWSESQGWREIAQKASKEQDPCTLIKLVQELCDKIDERDGACKKAPEA